MKKAETLPASSRRSDTDLTRTGAAPVRPPRPVRGGTRHQPPARARGKEVCKRPSGSGGGPLERLQGQVVAFQSTAAARLEELQL